MEAWFQNVLEARQRIEIIYPSTLHNLEGFCVPVTIKDIAERVGRSITTVSRALHDHDDVSQETKALVHRVAAEMGYSPNLIAQRLQKQRSDTVGLILPTFGPRESDPFFTEILAGVGDQAARLGYDLMVSISPPGEQEIQEYAKRVRGGRIDGFIIVRTRRQDGRIEYLRSEGFPFVAFGRTTASLDFPYVDEDGFHGMWLVGQHLLNLGHRRIAWIGAPAELTFAQHREQGLRQALEAGGAPLDPALVRAGDLTQRSGYEQVRALLAEPEPPSAIAAGNDLMAFGAMHAAQEHGLAIGRDIAITGFDDIPLAEHTQPPLTTVHQPIYQIGGMLCEMLVQRLNGRPLEQEQVILEPSLVVRQSSQRSEAVPGSSRNSPTEGGEPKQE
jgi:LacI family transcriptional regulator